jgi:hypothetical protein
MWPDLHRAEAIPVVISLGGWTLLGLTMNGMGAAPLAPAAVLAMVATMMLPLTVPGVRVVVAVAPWWRRKAAVAQFLAAYLGVWSIAAVVVAAAPTRPLQGTSLAIAFVACAVWQAVPQRNAIGRRCRRTPRLRPGGAGASLDGLAYGARAAGWCVLLCGPAMATMLLGRGGLPVMATIAAVAVADRIALAGTTTPRPELWLAGIYLLLAAGSLLPPA